MTAKVDGYKVSLMDEDRDFYFKKYVSAKKEFLKWKKGGVHVNLYQLLNNETEELKEFYEGDC